MMMLIFRPQGLMLCNGLDWEVSFYGDIIESLYRAWVIHLLRVRLPFREERKSQNADAPPPQS